MEKLADILLIEMHGSEAAQAGWDLLTGQNYQICRMAPNYPPIHTMKEVDWKSYWVGFPDGRRTIVLAKVAWVEAYPKDSDSVYEFGLKFIHVPPQGIDMLKLELDISSLDQ